MRIKVSPRCIVKPKFNHIQKNSVVLYGSYTIMLFTSMVCTGCLTQKGTYIEVAETGEISVEKSGVRKSKSIYFDKSFEKNYSKEGVLIFEQRVKDVARTRNPNKDPYQTYTAIKYWEDSGERKKKIKVTQRKKIEVYYDHKGRRMVRKAEKKGIRKKF